MTIQVAVMNGYGLAMASDRHVYRGGDARSTGQDVKLLRLRGRVPAAMMASGPFAVFGLPVSRLALRLERALAAAAPSPATLAEAVLACFAERLDGPGIDADADLLAEAAAEIAARARRAAPDAVAGLNAVLAELEQAPRVRDADRVEADARAAWDACAGRLAGASADLAALLAAPELSGRAVGGALARDWRRAGDLYVTVGLVCPATGVPVLVALRLWRGLGTRLHFVSRLDGDYEASWRAGRTVVVAQGSGRPLLEAMLDGLADDHWAALPPAGRDAVRGGMDARWDRAHGRLGVASLRELAAIAAGLVRGAEVIGFLTREGEGTVAEVDCLTLAPRRVAVGTLPAGPPARSLAA
jgi:hypothetical protein